jgi:osmotically-inducible protein OsmY
VLWGTVFEDDTKRRAEAAASNVEGVSRVISNLRNATQSWAKEEDLVTRELQNAGLSNVTIHIIGGDAYLNGQVSSQEEKDRATQIAQSAGSLVIRTNLIRVVPHGFFGD